MMKNRFVAMLVVMAAVTGCSDSANTDGAGKKSAAKTQAAGAPEAVAAVLQSLGTPIAKVGFVILTNPVVGTESVLRLELIASAPVPTLLVATEGGAGLVVDPATAQASFALEPDLAVSHELKFTPQQEGLTEITVRLRSAAENSVQATYAIPVLVSKAATGD